MEKEVFEQLNFFEQLKELLENKDIFVDYDGQGKSLAIYLGDDQNRQLVLVVSRISEGSSLRLFTGFYLTPNAENLLNLISFSSKLHYAKAVVISSALNDDQKLEIVLTTDIYDALNPSENIYYNIFAFIEFYKNVRPELEKLTSSIILLS